MQHQYNMRSPAVKRLMKEAQELRDSTELFYAQPLDDNLFEWHFTIRGPGDTEFDGGIFHGRIVLPPDYPMKPPSIIILTPNGRFEVNKKICLSISGHHPESWQPSWSIRTTLLAIIGFMPTHGAGAIGSLDYTPDERKVLSKRSLSWKCAECGNVSEILKPLTDASKETSQEAKALASQINFQGEKGDKSNKGKATPTTPTAPLPSPTSSSSSPSVSNSSSQGATAANTTSAPAAAAATTLPQMMFPSAMNPGGMPNMFPPMPPFLPPMAGQFPFPYRFPYPPMNNDSNGMPCNLMMPPFPNPFMPPMFPAGFTFPAAGNPENQPNSTNVPPSFPFPFMPAAPPPPTVPASSSNPTAVASSNPVTVTSSQATNSVNKSPSTSPSTSSTSTTTPTTSTSQGLTRNHASGAISKHSKDPSAASASNKNTGASTSSLSSSSDASNTAKASSEENQKSSETAETSTTNESGLRHRSTAGSGDPSVASANSDRPTAATQPTAAPAPARAVHSRSTPSFLLMVLLGVAILLLCLRRLYISSDNLPYPDYQH